MNDISLALKIAEFDINPEAITEMFRLQPTDSHLKGSKYFIGPPNNRLCIEHTENYWEYRVSIKNNTVWVKELIDRFVVEILYANKSAIIELKDKCRLEFYIGIWFYNSLDNYHFNTKTLHFLAENYIEIDIDQYLSNHKIQ